MNEEQTKAILEWHALYLRTCPLCDGGQFLADNICEMPVRGEPGKVFAAIPVVCKSCGYTVIVSTNALKITPACTDPKSARA